MPALGSLVGLAILTVAFLVVVVILVRQGRRLQRRLEELSWEVNAERTLRHKLRAKDGHRLLSWAAILAGALGLRWLWRHRDQVALAAASGTAGFLLNGFLGGPPSDEIAPVPGPTVTVYRTVTASPTATVTVTVTVTETVQPRPVSDTRVPQPDRSAAVARAPEDRPEPTPAPGQDGDGDAPPAEESPPADGDEDLARNRCLLAADAEVDELARLRLRAECPGQPADTD